MAVVPLSRIPRLSPLYLIFALILAAALALGRYSYENAQLLADQSERSLAETNRVLGEQTLQRIDNFIIDSDNSLLDIVDVDNLKDFANRWTQIVRLSQPIEAAIVLSEQQHLVKEGYVSKRRGEEARQFLDLFVERILPELELDTLELDLHKHLHTVVDGHDYLLSYMKRSQQPLKNNQGRVYYVVLVISIDYIVKEFFPQAFESLAGRELFAVVDKDDRVLYGERVQAPANLLYEHPFPTTLYKWRLQVAPPKAAGIAVEQRRKRISDAALIGLMVATILGGIAFLIYAVRKERRANQLKSEFISNVSHELKTPLSLIRMFGELLATGRVKTPEAGKEYAGIITRESERLTSLIDNVLDFSRIERGKASYDLQPGNLSAVVARALDVYRLRFEREGVKLSTEIEDDLPDTRFDESAMTLVLLNLLDNAVKYGGDAGGKVDIVVRLKHDRSRIRLTVTDHGQGIPEDEQRRIFDRFYRGPSVREKNQRGSGIGLSLVKHIAEAHGGRVSVDSVKGKGSTFIVTVPIRPIEDGAGEPPAAPLSSTAKHRAIALDSDMLGAAGSGSGTPQSTHGEEARK